MNKQLIISGLDHSLRRVLQTILNKTGILKTKDSITLTDTLKHTSNLAVQELNKKILSTISQELNIISAEWGWTQNGSFNKSYFPYFREKAREILESEEQKESQGFYDNKAGLILDLWTSISADTKCIIFYFPPWEVFGNNYLGLNNINSGQFLDFWCWYNQHLLDFYLENKDRCILININCLNDNKIGFIKTIREKFNLTIDNINFIDIELENYQIPPIEEKYINLTKEHLGAVKIYDLLIKHTEVPSVFTIPANSQFTELYKTKESYVRSLINFSNQLQLKNENAETTINLLNKKNDRLYAIVRKLENRINEIENSRLWKIKKKFTKAKSSYRNSVRTTKKIRLLKYLRFLYPKRFIYLIRIFFKVIFKYLYIVFEDKPVKIFFLEDLNKLSTTIHSDPYQVWIEKNSPRESEINDYYKNIHLFQSKPLFSILVPIYNPPEKYFREMIESVIGQVYSNWELCLSDDNSSNIQIRKIIKEYADKDSRIKFVLREENGHISACSNSALSIAQGDFLVLLDHDDLLTSDALYQIAYKINLHPEADLIYSDEDKIDENGMLKSPHFKPAWCPDNLLSRNYLGHLIILRSKIVKEIGGFREGFEGSQDHDLLLRFTEKTNHIYHIPKVLYHWRMHMESTASNAEAKPYAYLAAQRALQEALIRRDEPGYVSLLPLNRGYSIRYKIKNTPKVSIIIPNKNKAKFLEACLNSIFSKTSYENYEVIVVDNGSNESDIFKLYDKNKKEHNEKFNVFNLIIPFNFSKIINYGATKASGDFLLLLNNDTEVITEDWLEAMIEYAQRKATGVVGAKLLYSNDTIQHAGVIIGLGGAAGHSFVGNYKDDTGYYNYIGSVNNYSALTGACIMVKKELFDELNGFDEDFTVEYNDVDFCLRLKEKGFNNVYLPHVELYHYESISRGSIYATKESFEKHEKEFALFREKWLSYIEEDPCYSKNLSLEATDFRIKEK